MKKGIAPRFAYKARGQRMNLKQKLTVIEVVLAIVAAVVFVVFVVKAYGATDFKCLSDCMGKGYSYGYCKSLCSY